MNEREKIEKMVEDGNSLAQRLNNEAKGKESISVVGIAYLILWDNFQKLHPELAKVIEAYTASERIH